MREVEWGARRGGQVKTKQNKVVLASAYNLTTHSNKSKVGQADIPVRFPLKRKIGTLEELDRHLRTLMYSAGHNKILSDNNQAAVISDPQNHVFVLKNSGFATAYGVTGSYDVLAIVDQTHFPHGIKDRVTGAILGRSFEVRMTSPTGPREFVNQGLCRCVIALHHWRELIRDADEGHMHTTSSSKVVDFDWELCFTCRCTRNQVPMSLTLYLKQELEDSFKLAVHGSMVKQHPIGGDSVENSESSSQFLDALGTHATDDLHTAALEYGTIPQGLAAIHRRDRQHDGEVDQVRSGSPSLGRLHANETVIAPQNVDHENSKKVKQEEGVLSVARIKAQARTVRRGRRRRILDRRGAHATRFAVEAVAIRINARADAEVVDEFALETSRRRQEIQRIAAFGHKAVFVPTEVMDVASQRQLRLGIDLISAFSVGVGGGQESLLKATKNSTIEQEPSQLVEG
ncbi:hypothetical protein EDB85DRAFT_1899649 [Lactarius pseudohatsudake]|nr:hypothetical protein EDB85DRAFT_1899649 [Lactarius pseudohatsudake]